MPQHQSITDDKNKRAVSSSKSARSFSVPLAAPAQLIQRVHNPRITPSPAEILSLQRTIGNHAVQRLLAERVPAIERQTDPSHRTVVPAAPLVRQSTVMRSPLTSPSRNQKGSAIKHRAPVRQIQRAGNWEDFKDYTKGIWGRGGKFWQDTEPIPELFAPRQAYKDYANKGGKLNKFKGVMAGAGHVLASPILGLYGLGALGVRGLETLGAGAYYGAKGTGSMLKSGAITAGGAIKSGAITAGGAIKSGALSAGRAIKSGATTLGRGAVRMGTGIKDFFNKDRNPSRFDRNRVPSGPSASVEVLKPAAAIGLSGGVGGALESTKTAAGFPGFSGVLGALSTGDSILTWLNGNKMRDSAKARGDLAGEKVGNRKANQGKWGVLGGLMSTSQGALNLSTAIEVGQKGLMSMNDLFKNSNYVSSSLGVAGAGLGIAGSAISGAQGLWKSGKAASKLYSLSKSQPMLTAEGERWKARVKDREKTKLGLNALKVAASGLGIAAGALVIASNPVGWALGAAAAATLGALMGYKIYMKCKKAWRKRKAKHELREEGMPGLEELENEQENGGENPQGQNEFIQNQQAPVDVDRGQRKRAVALGNLIALKTSKSAQVAAEMRAALQHYKHPHYSIFAKFMTENFASRDDVRKYYANKGLEFPEYMLKTIDAEVLIRVLNLTPEQVLSESGQELIEKKLSATDSL